MQSLSLLVPDSQERSTPDNRGNWQTTPQCLATAHQIWGDAVVVDGEPATRSPKPGKDLVCYQEYIVLATELAQLSEPSSRRQDNPLSAHDGLNDHTRCLGMAVEPTRDFSRGTAKRETIYCLDKVIGKWIAKRRARGQLERTQRETMVGGLEDQDSFFAGSQESGLQGDLDSVRAGNSKEHLSIVDRCLPEELPGQLRAVRVGMDITQPMHQQPALLANGGDDRGVSMPHRRDPEPSRQIQIAIAIHIEDIGAQGLLPDKSVAVGANRVDTWGLVAGRPAG